MREEQRIVIIGGGLAGLSAAICLRVAGHDVLVLEKNERVGGKVNVLREQGYTFDTGPSNVTMPWTLHQLFARAGRRLEDYVTLTRVESRTRAFYEDGLRFDLSDDLPRLIEHISQVNEQDGEHILSYLSMCQKMYELSKKSVYKINASTQSDLQLNPELLEYLMMDASRSMDRVMTKHIQDERLRQLFNFFALRTGSSPYDAPAVLSRVVFEHLGLGTYYVQGGIYSIVQAMMRLLDELGVEVRTRAEVEKIDVVDQNIRGVVLRAGTTIPADLVVCNQDVVPTYQTLLQGQPQAHVETQQLERFDPTVSAYVLLLGINRTYSELTHHNFFFSRNAAREFYDMYTKNKTTEDPTVYVSISSKTDPTQAPDGKENWVVVTHVPALKRGDTWETNRKRYRDFVLNKLERMGAPQLRQHIECEQQLTPDDFQSLYGSNGGSIYGVRSDRKRNEGLKISSRCPWLKGLYFVGSSTHPGGGVPMVVLSGQMVSELVLKDVGNARPLLKTRA